MLFHAERAHRDAGESELADRSLSFVHGGLDVLKRHESDRLEPWAFSADAGDPVIVTAAEGGGVIFFWQLGDAETAGRKQDRDVDLFGIHIAQPGLQVRAFRDQFTVHTRVPDIVRQKRALAPAVWLSDKLAQIGVAVYHVPVGIDDVDVS